MLAAAGFWLVRKRPPELESPTLFQGVVDSTGLVPRGSDEPASSVSSRNSGIF